MAIKNTDYIVIQAPMITTLKLSGNSLVVFALIHGFSKDGVNRFTGSIDYIAEWTNISRRAVIEILKKLTNDGLITKNEITKNGVRFCEYMSNYDVCVANFTGGAETSQGVQNLHGGCKNCTEVVQNLHRGSAETSPNNNNYNIDNNNSVCNNAHARAHEDEYPQIKNPKLVDGELVRDDDNEKGAELVMNAFQSYWEGERGLNRGMYIRRKDDFENAKELYAKFKIEDAQHPFRGKNELDKLKFFLMDAYESDEWYSQNSWNIKIVNTQFNDLLIKIKNAKNGNRKQKESNCAIPPASIFTRENDQSTI